MGRSRSGSTYTTPSDPPGEFVFPVVTNSRIYGTEVLDPRNASSRGATRVVFTFNLQQPSIHFRMLISKDLVGKEKSPHPPFLHSLLKSDQKKCLSEHQK